MGGKILEYEAKTIYRHGFAIGYTISLFLTVIECCNDCQISEDLSAKYLTKRFHMPLECAIEWIRHPKECSKVNPYDAENHTEEWYHQSLGCIEQYIQENSDEINRLFRCRNVREI